MTQALLTSILAMATLGLANPAASSGLEVLKAWDLGHGNLTSYGYAAGQEPPATKAAKRGCNGSVSCSTSHTAGQQLCAGLITAMAGAISENEVDNSPRAYCYEASGQGGGKCCISWSSPVNAQFQNFVGSASDISNQCGGQNAGKVSGEVKGAVVGTTCTAVCVSNRPDGCEW